MNIEKALKRLIIICWITLIGCFIIKLFGGNYFKIVADSKNYILLCKSIEHNWILCNLVQLIFNLIANTIYLLIVTDRKLFSRREALIIYPLMILFFIIKSLNNTLGIITDIIQAIIIPMFMINYRKWYRIIIGLALDFTFQFLAFTTKDLFLQDINDNILTGTIFMIDYYIMLLLTYLYNNRLRILKEMKLNG